MRNADSAVDTQPVGRGDLQATVAETPPHTPVGCLDGVRDRAHHHSMPPDSWIFTEPYAGLQAQALGLAEAGGFKPSIVDLRPRAFYRMLPQSLWTNAFGAGGLRQMEGLMFTTGGAGAAVGATLHKKGNRVVQVQHPRMALDNFDLIVVNQHDEVTGANVIVTRTALHRVTPARLAEARAIWAPRFAHLPRPLVGVLVGGSNGRYRLEAAEGSSLARSLVTLMNFDKAGLIVTPSRRTSAGVREALQQVLGPRGAWIWDLQGENPYFGILACADIIVATMDSVSMVSEAVATGAPVLIAELPGTSRRSALFLRMLYDADRVRQFFGRVEYWPVKPLDDTQAAADEMRRRLGL
jgi:mitochondrial fission protein ELM1